MRQVHRMTNHFLNHILPSFIIRTKTISWDKTCSSRHTPKTSNTIHLLMLKLTSLVAQTVKRMPATQETLVQSLGQEDPLEKEMVTHYSILAWRIPWTEEPGGLQSTGLQGVGHNWATSLHFTSLWASLALPFFGIGMKTDLFQSCGHCWVFQICWHIECSTFTASCFRI